MTLKAYLVVSLSNLLNGIKKLLVDIVNRFNYSYLGIKISEKLAFLKFASVIYQTGRSFLAKNQKNRFFSNYLHKSELHLRGQKFLSKSVFRDR